MLTDEQIDDLVPMPAPEAIGAGYEWWDGGKSYGYTSKTLRAHTRAAVRAALELQRQLAEQPTPQSNCVPGKVRCSVCGFSLLRTNLYVNTGTYGPGNECIEPCPNDGNPMLPVSWEAEAKESWKTAEGFFDRAIAAEKALEVQRQEVERLREQR